MSRPTLEIKIGKTLRKANRLKATHAKLERVDELLTYLRHLLAPLSALPESSLTEVQQHEKQRLNGYVELCVMHKLKFQIDAVLTDVRSKIQRLKQAPQLQNQEYIEPLVCRLRAIMVLDADYLEAHELFHHLTAGYPQYAQDMAEDGRYLSITPHKAPDMRITIICHKDDLEKYATIRAKFPLYRIPATASSKQDSKECRMRFSLKDLDDFELFHEELRTRPSYRVSINGHPIQEHHFTDWFHCYTRFRKANTPNYCYGASPFTFNVFGCHKLYTPDIDKRLDLCWFSHGTLDPASGFFFLESARLLQHINHHLEHCGFCPALTQEKLSIGLNVLPYALNPECDDRWHYWPPHTMPERVIPTGNALAIASDDIDVAHVDLSKLIEVAPTPYVEKLLQYLETGDFAHLSTSTYRGLSTCIQCGVPYKPNTMSCGKCRVDFWKHAFQDLEQVLNHIRSLNPIKLPSPSHKQPAAVSSTSRSELPRHDSAEENVSFEQLWNDPQVQQMLTHDMPQQPASPVEAASHEPAAPESQPQSSPDNISQYRESLRAIAEEKRQPPEAQPPHESLERLQFHEKIWGLVSKKYRERKAIEHAFLESSHDETSGVSEPGIPPFDIQPSPPTPAQQLRQHNSEKRQPPAPVATPPASSEGFGSNEPEPEKAALLHTIKNLKPRQKSELSTRGVVRVVYLATMDKDSCPLCAYLDGMVMDPDDPATDIFSPPLYPGCTCRREYVLKTEKPQNWPRVTFTFPPEELLIHLDK